MDRHLTLAAVFAAAVHGGLLFGVPSRPAPARPVEAKPPDFVVLKPLLPDEPEIIVAPPEDSQPQGNPEAFRPVIDDVPVIAAPHEFTTHVVVTPPVDFTRMKEIPSGVVGIRDGRDPIARPVIFQPGSLDRSPRTIAQPPPIYPFDKKKEGISGEVQVEFTVDEAGRVVEPRVVHSTDRAFDEPTLQAVRRWRFEPGRRHGEIVRFRMAIPVRFLLNE